MSSWSKVMVGVLLLGVAGAACTRSEPTPSGASAQQSAPALARVDPRKRGKELVTLGGCNDCHTPMKLDPALGMPVPQMDRMLSGHPEGAPDPEGAPGKTDQGVIGSTFTAFKLPFGVVYAANLTPDPETGLRMSEDEFVKAMRTGKHQGKADGRPILPPMPWMNLAQAPEEDLRAIHAFLRTIPPVKNRVPEPRVPAPAIAEIAKSYAKMGEHAAPVPSPM